MDETLGDGDRDETDAMLEMEGVIRARLYLRIAYRQRKESVSIPKGAFERFVAECRTWFLDNEDIFATYSLRRIRGFGVRCATVRWACTRHTRAICGTVSHFDCTTKDEAYLEAYLIRQGESEIWKKQ